MTYQSLPKRLLRPISRSLHGIIKLKMASDGVDWAIPMNISGKLPTREQILALEAPIFECGPGHFSHGYSPYGISSEFRLNKADILTITGAATSLTGI